MIYGFMVKIRFARVVEQHGQLQNGQTLAFLQIGGQSAGRRFKGLSRMIRSG